MEQVVEDYFVGKGYAVKRNQLLDLHSNYIVFD